MKKTILKIMLGSIIAEVVIVCFFILLGDFNEVAARACESIAVIFGYSIPCLFYARVFDKEKYKNIAIVGSITAALAALISIYLILQDIYNDYEILEKALAVLSIVVGCLASVSWILSYPSVNNLFSNFKKAAIVLISIFSLYMIINVFELFEMDGFLLRLYFVLCILSIGSLISILIMTRIYKKEISEERALEEQNLNAQNEQKFIDSQSQEQNVVQPHIQNFSTLPTPTINEQDATPVSNDQQDQNNQEVSMIDSNDTNNNTTN